MLELQDIKKVYKTGDSYVEALKGVTLKFRESEFVSILGQSGCGKTTLLNIIGGLDRYSSGDLIINGKSTKQFKDKDWDAYRNYKVGFVFQSYNLIGHQTVLSNVELALTLGGVSKAERRQRAIKALEDVGLGDQINKKPNQLSGGQMQRVAIARALVNDPDIILADEPTGALDTKTSVQVMEILKSISKNKLIVMVTHNPELAMEYSSRVIRILDGVITEDSNPIRPEEEINPNTNPGIGRTKMSFWTAFRLSLNNLLTKKGRTILIAFAGSIGIIGIALIQATSNGFQSYVDHIQEDTLTSYPLSIMQESTDITSMLLSMQSGDNDGQATGTVTEKQYISDMLSSIKANDLKSFISYYNKNIDKLKGDVASVKYSYSVDPQIYTYDTTNTMVKLNPSNLFTSMMGGSSIMSSYSSMGSVFSQMTDDQEALQNSYDVLAGRWPKEYNEMILVLSEPNTISDLLVYSLGLRENDELTDMVNKIMKGEGVKVDRESLKFSYEDLMNVKLKLIRPTDKYKYNSEYDVFEDMSDDEAFMADLYNNSPDLKIVGIVTGKPGVSSSALSPGVAYTSKLIDYIIDYSAETEIVKKQLANPDVDVISGNRFDAKKNELGLSFSDLVKVDTSAFSSGFDQKAMEETTAAYMQEITSAVTTDTTPAKNDYIQSVKDLSNGMFDSIQGSFTDADIPTIVSSYLATSEANDIISGLTGKYSIPAEMSGAFKTAYSGMLQGVLMGYTQAYQMASPGTPIVVIPTIQTAVINGTLSQAAFIAASEQMASKLTEAKMQVTIATKVGELLGSVTNSFASAMSIDPATIANAFQLSMSEEQITRVITSMMTKKQDSTQHTNLVMMGYQDKDDPTYISYYFKSFDGKERFLSFIDNYNEEVKAAGEDDKEIKYSDTTGILMGSVRTIVDAVSYVLIAFVSISLIVSSIMIGIITYISVFERTKEIGILRAIGASKMNISNIFNAETFIIGLLSGFIGMGISYALCPVINMILHKFIGNIPLNVVIYPQNALILIILSVVLTLIGGLIPASSASKKDPVIALRTE